MTHAFAVARAAHSKQLHDELYDLLKLPAHYALEIARYDPVAERYLYELLTYNVAAARADVTRVLAKNGSVRK